jgi:hypothetical protein
MAAEGELVAGTNVNHVVDSLPVPVPPKKKKMTGESMKYRRRCYQPELDQQLTSFSFMHTIIRL